MKNKLMITVSVLLSVVISEMGLRSFTRFPIHDPTANRAPHDALGYTLSREFSEADPQGFRNHDDIARAETVAIAAIGDSHTYGYNVAAQFSWPGYLSAITGSSVYNYGMGGYGILHYRYLFYEALNKKPDVILIGLYLANDLANYCDLAPRDYWKPIIKSAGLTHAVCDGSDDKDMNALKITFRQRIKFTAIGSLLAHLRHRYLYWLERDGVSFAIGEQKTWTADERLKAIIKQTDTGTPGIQEAKRAAFFFLMEMANAANAAGVDFGIVLIPSRERVMYRCLKENPDLPPDWHHAVRLENNLVREFGDFFVRTGIPFVDSLPFVQRALDVSVRGGAAIYPVADGHPVGAGYQAYAHAASTLLARK